MKNRPPSLIVDFLTGKACGIGLPIVLYVVFTPVAAWIGRVHPIRSDPVCTLVAGLPIPIELYVIWRLFRAAPFLGVMNLVFATAITGLGMFTVGLLLCGWTDGMY